MNDRASLEYTGPTCTECRSPMLWLDCGLCGGDGAPPSDCEGCDGTGHDWFCPECEPDKFVDWIPF